MCFSCLPFVRTCVQRAFFAKDRHKQPLGDNRQRRRFVNSADRGEKKQAPHKSGAPPAGHGFLVKFPVAEGTPDVENFADLPGRRVLWHVALKIGDMFACSTPRPAGQLLAFLLEISSKARIDFRCRRAGAKLRGQIILRAGGRRASKRCRRCRATGRS